MFQHWSVTRACGGLVVRIRVLRQCPASAAASQANGGNHLLHFHYGHPPSFRFQSKYAISRTSSKRYCSQPSCMSGCRHRCPKLHKLWDVATWKERAAISYPQLLTYSGVLSPDGKRIAVERSWGFGCPLANRAPKLRSMASWRIVGNPETILKVTN